MKKMHTDEGGWDVHTHLVPQKVVAAARNAAYGMSTDERKLTVCAHGVPLHPISDAEKLVERIRADRLDGAVVSVPPPLFRPDIADDERRSYAGFVNDALQAACDPHASMLRPLAYLPPEAPDLAADIAEGLDRTWAGVVLGTELGGKNYSADSYEALWSVLERQGLSVFLHPGSSSDERLAPFYLANLLGNPYETTVAAAHIVFGGVLHRHPKLNIVLAHGGGCAAVLAGRWQRGATTDRPGVSELSLLPLDAMRRFYVDSLVHSPAYLDLLIEMVGPDRVLLGSDWPFPMGAESADHDLGHLTAELRQRIRRTNAEAAFGARLLSPQGV
jgi:aminocarboxymuconate-semialdehyde decarboxylase